MEKTKIGNLGKDYEVRFEKNLERLPPRWIIGNLTKEIEEGELSKVPYLYEAYNYYFGKSEAAKKHILKAIIKGQSKYLEANKKELRETIHAIFLESHIMNNEIDSLYRDAKLSRKLEPCDKEYFYEIAEEVGAIGKRIFSCLDKKVINNCLKDFPHEESLYNIEKVVTELYKKSKLFKDLDKIEKEYDLPEINYRVENIKGEFKLLEQILSPIASYKRDLFQYYS